MEENLHRKYILWFYLHKVLEHTKPIYESMVEKL